MAKWIKQFISFLFLGLSLFAGGVLWANQKLSAPLLLKAETAVLALKPGTGFSAMSAKLQRDGLIDYPSKVLDIYARVTGRAASIKAGEFELHQGMSSYDLIDLLISGEVVSYKVSLIEGKTFADFTSHLAKQETLEHLFDQATPLWQQLKVEEPLNQYPEGLFFPDTYSYTRGESDISILRRAYEKMLASLQNEWAERDDGLPYKSPYEALIMASIVEKETGVPSERGRIAGVFVTRLEKNMRLQTDPTVIYGLPENERNNLRSKHLADDSNLYNTYRHNGLPPTPIAMPGTAAIRAALHPVRDGSLYFVAKGDGSHHFSKTLEEHQKAVRKYQLRRREDYRSSPVQ